MEAVNSDGMNRAYARLETLTPLPTDCGQLCRKRCCKGREGAGMILFPGENLGAPYTVRDETVSGFPIGFATCNGRCDRRTRPLGCRIFPFAPYLDAEGVLAVIPDPRAKFMCPLLTESALKTIDPQFLRAVEQVFTDLLESAEDMRPMLSSYSKMLDDYIRFAGYKFESSFE